MADTDGSQLVVDWFGLQRDVVNFSNWNIGLRSWCFVKWQNAPSRQNRGIIVQAIIHNRSTYHLRRILESDWDIDEVLTMPDHARDISSVPRLYHKTTDRTALLQAARQGWTEGAQMLLDAGAQCVTSKYLGTHLSLALQNRECPLDMIELLLKHGADPNFHDNFLVNIPLYQAIYGLMFDAERYTRIVHLLLMHEADPNVPNRSIYTIHSCPLHALIKLFSQYMHRITDTKDFTDIAERMGTFQKKNLAIFKMLVDFGADVNWEASDIKVPRVLHKIVGQHFYRGITVFPRSLFLAEHLDLFFQQGGDINILNAEHLTALEYASSVVCGHSNCIRWLIRHGADTTQLNLTSLGQCIFPIPAYPPRLCQQHQGFDTPLILLKAGMRISQESRACLLNMEETVVHDASEEGVKQAQTVWQEFVKDKKKENVRKLNFSEFLSKQTVDLQEFSDVTLHIYPREVAKCPDNPRQYLLDQLHMILEFLSQPQSLQWHCRSIVRANLVSLQPSVVKTLKIPVGLKRFILCHDI